MAGRGRAAPPARRGGLLFRERSQEEPDYRALETDGDHQIRDYPGLTVAETVVNGPRRAALDEGIGSSPTICRPSRATAKATDDEPRDPGWRRPDGQRSAIVRRRSRRRLARAPGHAGGLGRDELPEPPAGVELVELPARKVAVVVSPAAGPTPCLKEQEDRLRGWLAKRGESPGRARICLLQFADDPRPLRRNEVLAGNQLKLDFSSSNASAASARRRPCWRASDWPGRSPAFILDRQYAVADRQPVHGQRHQPARAFPGDDLEMIGFAADHHAQRDIGVILAALGCQRDRPGQLQRAGHGDRLMRMARRLDRAARPPAACR